MNQINPAHAETSKLIQPIRQSLSALPALGSVDGTVFIDRVSLTDIITCGNSLATNDGLFLDSLVALLGMESWRKSMITRSRLLLIVVTCRIQVFGVWRVDGYERMEVHERIHVTHIRIKVVCLIFGFILSNLPFPVYENYKLLIRHSRSVVM